jgi:hypothetical protein
MKSDHYVHLDVNWAMPALFMSLVAVFILTVQEVFEDYLVKWGFTMQSLKL